jgi:MoaA/NifB/PqqE/SkfB family radical SAM enzyme
MIKIADIVSYELEITSDCNAACPLCSRTEQGMPNFGNDNISLSDIQRLFDDTDALVKGKTFNFSGAYGDPIVNPEFYEIAKYFVDNGGYVSINTNGGYNTVKWWERLATLDRLEVQFAVDGHAETNHIYRVNVKWETVLRNMTAFSQAGGRGSWAFIAFEHNECEFDIAKQTAIELGFRFIRRTSNRTMRVGVKTSTDRKTAQQVKIVDSKKATPYVQQPDYDMYDIRRALNKNDIPVLKEASKTVSCKMVDINELFIAADMKLWPCCFLNAVADEDMNNDHLGPDFNNLKVRSIIDIVNDEFFQKLSDRWDPEKPHLIKTCLKTCAKGAKSRGISREIISK